MDIIPTLAAMSAVAIRGLSGAADFHDALIRGKWSAAQHIACAAAQVARDDLSAAFWWQACGDAALLADSREEAESAYGSSVRRAPRSAAPQLAGRASARKVLHGIFHPSELGAQRFWRLPESALCASTYVEQLAGLAIMCERFGWHARADGFLARLAQSAQSSRDSDVEVLAHSLSDEFIFQATLFAQPVFCDRVDWSGEHRSAAGPHLAGRASLDPSAAGHSLVDRVLAERNGYKRRVLSAIRATAGTPGNIPLHTPVQQWCNAARLEKVLVALALQRLAEAEQMLRPLEHQGSLCAADPTLTCEILIVRACLRMQQNRRQESVAIYADYARACANAALQSCQSFHWVQGADAACAGQAVRLDDVSARLPARYRRAYAWMSAHLDDRNLTVKDVADHIGVSERALQQAFQRYLGATPTEVLRQMRMQRIHAELATGTGTAELIRDVALKFGVSNRTSLAFNYRRLYQHVPSAPHRRLSNGPGSHNAAEADSFLPMVVRTS